MVTLVCLTPGGQPNLRGRTGFLGDKTGETGWTLQRAGHQVSNDPG